jgi:hypothetical protein
MRVALVNDYRTRIPNTRTLWDFLEETINARFFSTRKWFWKKDLQKYDPDLTIQNAYWGNLGVKCRRLVVLVQDNFPGLMENGYLDPDICMKGTRKIRNAIEVADHVVVNVRSLVRRFEIPQEKATWIPIGVDGSKFYPSVAERSTTRKELRIDGRCNMFVGDTTEIHGWSQVLQKIEQTPNSHWIIATKNSPSNLMGDNIHQFCNITHDKLRNLYNASDMFFARGSIGLPAIEAMFCGVKVDISHNLGYFEEWYPANANPRAEAISAGWELSDVVRRWKNLVKRQTNGRRFSSEERDFGLS